MAITYTPDYMHQAGWAIAFNGQREVFSLELPTHLILTFGQQYRELKEAYLREYGIGLVSALGNRFNVAFD